MVAPKKQNGVEPYGLDPAFERALVSLICQRPNLFGRIGTWIETEALGDASAQLLVQAAQLIASEVGSGPDSTLLVVQRLHRMLNAGQVTQEQINACSDLLDLADDFGLPDEAAVINEMVPTLRRRGEKTALYSAMDAFGKQQDLKKAVEQLGRVERLGTALFDTGIRVGAGSFESIRRLHGLARLPMDVPEIDTLLEGGLWRKALGVVMAPPAGGKSIFLSHLAGAASRNGIRTAVATLELPEPIILARIKANLLGLPINDLLDGFLDEAQRRMEILSPHLGLCVVKEFAPKATTVGDLTAWIKRVEDEIGDSIELLIVDYADKLGTGKDESSYVAGGVVYEGLRYYAVENDKWVWTASQPRRSEKGARKRIELDQVADSMEKVRVADVVLTITPRNDGELLLYYLAKNRMGKTGASIGPLPHDFACGRIAPVVREDGYFDVVPF